LKLWVRRGATLTFIAVSPDDAIVVGSFLD